MKKGIVAASLGLLLIIETTGCGAKEQAVAANTSEIEQSKEQAGSEEIKVVTSESGKVDNNDSVISENKYSAVIDRVLTEFEFTPVAWDNTIEWDKESDALIKMAQDPTGRYQVWGIISKEAGSYGLILDDTIDGTDTNTNYVYEPWHYTGNSEGEPKLEWDDDKLMFSYPIPTEDGYEVKTVLLDCRYDTGHMEFADGDE